MACHPGTGILFRKKANAVPSFKPLVEAKEHLRKSLIVLHCSIVPQRPSTLSDK